MIYGFNQYVIAGIALVLAAGLIGFGYFMYLRRKIDAETDGLQPLATDGSGMLYSRPPAPVKSNRVVNWMSSRYRDRKQKKALQSGKIRWYLVDEARHEPKFVEPEMKEGGNIPELDHDGGTYLFPDDGMIPAAEDGIWEVFHRKGQAEPIDMRNTAESSLLPANTLKKYLELRVTNPKPGWSLPGFGDMDAMDMLRYTVIGMVLLFIIMEFTGGGIL